MSTVCIAVDGTESRVAWRTCSNGLADPCNQDGLLPGVKLISCQTCSTDKCNLMVEKENGKIYTFHINANVSLFLRQ